MSNKINRNTAFYSECDYNLDTQIGIEYLNHDCNQTVMVFQVDRNKTITYDIYGETSDDTSISYKEPVEINVVLNLSQAVNKTYDKNQNLGRYLIPGNLIFGVYEKTLKDNNIDISYGDFIGYQVNENQIEYFEVTNDGRVNFDNKHTMFGYKTFYRTIEATPVDKNTFNGI